jgi:hypothetical protein
METTTTVTHSIQYPELAPETKVYYSKVKSMVWIVMGAIGLGIACYIKFAQTGMGLYAILVGGISLVFILFAIIRLNNKTPQLIVSYQGLQAANVPFYSWAQISNEAVQVTGSGRFTKVYLTYGYPGGSARINAELLDRESHELEQLLNTYRARYEQGNVNNKN